jgi:hypothetical protein
MLCLRAGFPALTQFFGHFNCIIKSLGLGILPAAFFLKELEGDDTCMIRLIPYGLHITLCHASGLTAAEVTYIGDVIIELDGADWAERLTGAAGNAQGRGDNYLTVNPDLNGRLRTSGTVMLLTLLAHDRIVNANSLDFDHLYPCPVSTNPACMKKRAIDLAPKAPRTLLGIYSDHSY